MLIFFLFPVVNGQSTCCQFSSVESPITTIFVCPHTPALLPRCPLTQKSWFRPWNLPIYLLFFCISAAHVCRRQVCRRWRWKTWKATRITWPQMENDATISRRRKRLAQRWDVTLRSEVSLAIWTLHILSAMCGLSYGVRSQHAK